MLRNNRSAAAVFDNAVFDNAVSIMLFPIIPSSRLSLSESSCSDSADVSPACPLRWPRTTADLRSGAK